MKKISILILLFFCLSFSAFAKDKDKDKKYRGIDIDPLTGKVQIISSIKGEYINFTVSANDSGGSGVFGLCISNFDSTCSTWEGYDGSPKIINWQMLPGIGMRTIYIYVMDVTGKKSLTKIMVIKEE